MPQCAESPGCSISKFLIMKVKTPDIKPIPKAAPMTKPEDKEIGAAGDAERRRLRAMAGRRNTVTSKRNEAGLKTTFG